MVSAFLANFLIYHTNQLLYALINILKQYATTNIEMDRMIEHGENVLGSIKGQSEMLKGVKSKMLNVGNALGLSRTLIKMIDRRSVSDRYLLVIGMIVTCIIMFLTVKFLI